MDVRFRLYLNVIVLSVIFNLSVTCRVSVKIDIIDNKSPIITPTIFEFESESLMKGAMNKNNPPNNKIKIPKIDLSLKRNRCLISTVSLSIKISKLANCAISIMCFGMVNNSFSSFIISA